LFSQFGLDLCGTPGYLAPETLACSMYENMPGYGMEVDMWACGVILFTLLSGSPPFWHRRQIIMLRMIMEGNYSFSSPDWDEISDNAKDLIRNLLNVDPQNRFTAEQALNSPFFARDVRAERVFYSQLTKQFSNKSFHFFSIVQVKTGASVLCT
jgi:phosphorylase kinase gamma subunit